MGHHSRRRADTIAAEIAPNQALIADGHHRYAAYRALQEDLADEPESPWSFGLAMLVADGDSELAIGPIHRVVAGLTLRDVEDAAAERGDRFEPAAQPSGDLVQGESATFWLSDGTSWATLTTERSSYVDAAVLHDDLLPAWHVTDDQVSYHHSITQALQVAVREPSIVFLVAPPSLAQVTAAAAEGRRLPRKSTSFAPKPRMGVVMRDLRDA